MAQGTDSAILYLNGLFLSQVVAQRRQHQPQRLLCLLPQLRGLIQHQHGVVPHIPFRVESGVLGDADEGLCLREPNPQLAHPAQHLKKHRGPGGF